VAVLALAACGGGSSPTAPGPSSASGDVVEVAPDRWNFRRSASGRAFVPVGVNYDHDMSLPCPLLLEDYWHDRWADVERDFQEIASLGFNVVRVHLQFEQFIQGPGMPNQANLQKLDQLVRLAERNGLLLNLTGLGFYRRERVPAWYAGLGDDAAMEAEAAFWTAVASRYPDDPAIFAYDLQNEPNVYPGDTEDVVGVPFAPCDPDGPGPAPATGFSYVHNHFRHAGPRWTAWVQSKYATEAALRQAWSDFPRPGESFTAIARPGFFSSETRVRDHYAFMHDAAAVWTRRMVAAIRSVDRRHLITLGLTSGSLPFQDRLAADARELLIYSSFSPHHLRSLLDFTSVHVYPHAYGPRTNVDLSEMVLRGAHVGSPVVLEEMWPSVGGAPFERFLARSRGSVSGWFSFYWGRTPAELRATGTLPNAIIADWLERYSAFARNEVPSGGLTRAAAEATTPASIEALLFSQPARVELSDRYSSYAARDAFLDPVLQQ